MPRKYMDALYQRARIDDVAKSRDEFMRTLWDMDLRFKIMDKYEGLVHVLTPSGPTLERNAGLKDAAYLAQIYNDEMAELVARYPDRFVAAVACLPLNNIEATLQEIDRAVNELGFKGILINTPINGQPIDLPELMPIYEIMSKHDLPIWIHPRRDATVPDYITEDRSRYGISHCFGWPFETSIAMARIVFSGILDKYPNLKFITHHCGAMVPYLAARIEGSYDWYEVALQARHKQNLTKPPIEYFRMFYNDTAIYGNMTGLMCAYAFFGTERLLFGTDFPYDVELGDKYTRETIAAINSMDIPDIDKKKIFAENAKMLLHLGVLVEMRVKQQEVTKWE
jgi:aminocarboxymuconate-semialdehyde decarboxylase